MTIEFSGDGVALIEVSTFDALDSYDVDAGASLRQRILDAADDDRVRAIILALGENSENERDDRESPHDDAETFTPRISIYAGPTGLYQTVAYCKKVVVCEVSGPCSGAAALLSLYSDITYSSVEATFHSPFDVWPESNFVLAALTMRLDRAKDWVLRGTTLSADKAEEFGLINFVVEKTALRAATKKFAQRVARMPLDGVTVSKMNSNAVLDSMGVGVDFDSAGFFAAGMHQPDALGWS